MDHSQHHNMNTHDSMSQLDPMQQHQQASHDHMSHDSMIMMKMYFHFGLGDMLLFKSLVIDSNMKMIFSCLGLFLAAILLEAIDYFRGYLFCRSMPPLKARGDGNPNNALRSFNSGDTQLLVNDQQPTRSGSHPATPIEGCNRGLCRSSNSNNNINTNLNPSNDKPNISGLFNTYWPPVVPQGTWLRLIQASLQFTRIGLSFTLMLAAMTYNVCLIVAILLGAGVGFYIFYRPSFDLGCACY